MEKKPTPGPSLKGREKKRGKWKEEKEREMEGGKREENGRGKEEISEKQKDFNNFKIQRL